MSGPSETRGTLIGVYGQTAGGKSALAESLAHRLGAPILNADAFQVYRGLDIGTAKPADRTRYRLLDLKDPREGFGVGEWVALVQRELAELAGPVVVCGGTGLYLRALFEGYAEMKGPPDPALRERLNQKPVDELREELAARAPQVAQRTDLANPVRVRRALERLDTPGEPLRVDLQGWRTIKLVTRVEPAQHAVNLEARLDQMLAAGWADEVKGLLAAGVPKDAPGFRAIGYEQIVRLLEGEASFGETRLSILCATRNYAKRQRTWLRSEPKLNPVDIGQDERSLQRATDAALSLFEGLSYDAESHQSPGHVPQSGP